MEKNEKSESARNIEMMNTLISWLNRNMRYRFLFTFVSIITIAEVERIGAEYNNNNNRNNEFGLLTQSS
jgi:hypothetical protein